MDLDLPPDPEVTALAEQLRTAAPARRAVLGRATARTDGQAYHLYLQGRRLVSDYTLTAIARAVDCFERALAHDPTFALASASLAMAYIELAEQGGMEPDPAYRRAAEAAATALKLDPDLGEAHCTMGT